MSSIVETIDGRAAEIHPLVAKSLKEFLENRTCTRQEQVENALSYLSSLGDTLVSPELRKELTESLEEAVGGFKVDIIYDNRGQYILSKYRH